MRRFALLVVLAVAACGDDVPKGGPDFGDTDLPDQDLGPGAVTIAFEPTAIDIREGATGTVQLVTTRTGQAAEGDVVYSVSGVPNGIGSSISGDVMTLQVPFFAQNRSHTISVTATANNGRKNTASFTLTVLPPAPVDVRGTVIAYETGRPIENLGGAVEIALWGRGATTPVTITPTDATFAFDDVTPPYDVMVTYDITTLTRHLYLGLGRGDPKLTYFGYSTGRGPASAHTFVPNYSDPGSVGYDHLAIEVTCANGASQETSVMGTHAQAVQGTITPDPVACTTNQFVFDVGASFPEDYSSLQASTATVVLTSGSTDVSFTAGAASNHVVPVVYTPAPDEDPFVEYVWLLDGQRTVTYFGATAADAIANVVMPNDAAVRSGVCMSAFDDVLPYAPLNRSGSTICRLTLPTTGTADFGTLTKAALPGAPIGDTARGNIAFPSLGGFGAYIIGKVSPPEEATFVFSNGPITAQTMARHGLAFDVLPTMYDWRAFKLNGITSIDAFAGADVTKHGFVSRQSGYSVSEASGFRVTN